MNKLRREDLREDIKDKSEILIRAHCLLALLLFPLITIKAVHVLLNDEGFYSELKRAFLTLIAGSILPLEEDKNE